MWEQIQKRMAETDKEEGVATQCDVVNDIAPALSDPSIQSAIREAASSAGLHIAPGAPSFGAPVVISVQNGLLVITDAAS